MKTFAKGTKKRLGRGSSAKQKKTQDSEEDALVFNELFSGALEDTTHLGSLASINGKENTGPVFQLRYNNDTFDDGTIQQKDSFGGDTFGHVSPKTQTNYNSNNYNKSSKFGSIDTPPRQGKLPSMSSSNESQKNISSPATFTGNGYKHRTSSGNQLPVIKYNGGSSIDEESLSVDFQQPPENRNNLSDSIISNSGITDSRIQQIANLTQEVQDWKSKYLHLKKEYDALLVDYTQLLNQKQSDTVPKQALSDLQMKLHEKEQQIQLLKTQVQKKLLDENTMQRASISSETKMLSDDAERKIRSQNDEIQTLLEQRIQLEAELAELRYQGPKEGTGRTPSHGGGVGNTFEQERIINNLRASLKEKQEAITDLENDLAATRNELARLGGLMGIVAEQVEADEKKKKKSWWGKSKPKKLDPSKVPASDIEALGREASLMAGVTDSPRSTVSASPLRGLKPGLQQPLDHRGDRSTSPLSGGLGHSTMLPSNDLGAVFVNKRILELERENARLEGEIGILDKEKGGLNEQLRRLEAQLQIMEKTKKHEDAKFQSIAVARSLALPIPTEGGTEADRLRVVVQVQEAALQRLSLKSQQLSDTLKSYTSQIDVGGRQARMTEIELQSALQVSENKVHLLQKQNHELEEEKHLIHLNITASESEIKRLRDILTETQKTHMESTHQLKSRAETYAVMIGNLLKQTGTLNERLAIINHDHIKDATAYQGEIRALRDGRLSRLKGDPANHRVFPSIPSDTIHSLRGHQSLKSASKQRQITTTLSDDMSLFNSQSVLINDQVNKQSIENVPPGNDKQRIQSNQRHSDTFSVADIPPLKTETPNGSIKRYPSDISCDQQGISFLPYKESYKKNVNPTSAPISHQYQIRPVVSVELNRYPQNQNPESSSNQIYPGNQFGVEYNLHIPSTANIERDRAFAEAAMRAWENNPSVQRSLPSSPTNKLNDSSYSKDHSKKTPSQKIMQTNKHSYSRQTVDVSMNTHQFPKKKIITQSSPQLNDQQNTQLISPPLPIPFVLTTESSNNAIKRRHSPTSSNQISLDKIDSPTVKSTHSREKQHDVSKHLKTLTDPLISPRVSTLPFHPQQDKILSPNDMTTPHSLKKQKEVLKTQEPTLHNKKILFNKEKSKEKSFMISTGRHGLDTDYEHPDLCLNKKEEKKSHVIPNHISNQQEHYIQPSDKIDNVIHQSQHVLPQTIIPKKKLSIDNQDNKKTTYNGIRHDINQLKNPQKEDVYDFDQLLVESSLSLSNHNHRQLSFENELIDDLFGSSEFKKSLHKDDNTTKNIQNNELIYDHFNDTPQDALSTVPTPFPKKKISLNQTPVSKMIPSSKNRGPINNENNRILMDVQKNVDSNNDLQNDLKSSLSPPTDLSDDNEMNQIATMFGLKGGGNAIDRLVDNPSPQDSIDRNSLNQPQFENMDTMSVTAAIPSVLYKHFQQQPQLSLITTSCCYEKRQNSSSHVSEITFPTNNLILNYGTDYSPNSEYSSDHSNVA